MKESYLEKISLDPLKNLSVAIIGYGNQGRAHALNLRDSGISVVVGARTGKGWDQAIEDGFSPVSPRQAAEEAKVVMLLLPDHAISALHRELEDLWPQGKFVGFAHGFAYLYGGLKQDAATSYFLAGPKGAGAILRKKFTEGPGLPGVYAISSEAVRVTALAYCKAIGIANSVLIETNFREETECDLFGEQAVLCGGIFQLMEAAFDTLVKNGHSREMAFFETCFEARMILELWMQYGPKGVSERISPTAFFGGLTRGKRIVTSETHAELQKIFDEIRSGEFAKEWLQEVANGTPLLKAERKRLADTALEKVYQDLHEKI